MSLTPMKVKVLNDECVDLCKNIAKKKGVCEEDINSIFSFEKEEVQHPSLVSYDLVIEEGRPVKIVQKGRIIEVLGDNQVGKTTTLLYIANLLGYNFSNPDNADFLGDEKLVQQGREVFSKLSNGLNARLELNAPPLRLIVYTEKPFIVLDVFEGENSIEHKMFYLSSMSDKFRETISPFITVQFVSKGRNFDWQLLSDICQEIKWYTETIEKRTDQLIGAMRSALEESAKEQNVEGIDYNSRKLEIQQEKQTLKAQLEENKRAILPVKMKLESIAKVQSKLPELEKTKEFKLLQEIQETGTKLGKYKERLETLKRVKENAQAVEIEIETNKQTLKEIDEEKAEKERLLKVIDDKFNEAMSAIEKKTPEFLDSNQAFAISKLLKERHIDALLTQSKQTEPKAVQVIKDLYDLAKSYDGIIRLPDNLWGSVAALKEKIETAKKIIDDDNLSKKAIDPLIVILQEKDMLSTQSYNELKSSIDSLQQQAQTVSDNIAKIEKARAETDDKQEDEALKRTDKNVITTEKKVKELEAQIAAVKDRKTIEELENLQKDLSILFPDSEGLAFSTDWEDQVFTLKEATKKQFDEQEIGLQKLEQSLQKLGTEEDKINSFLGNPKLALYAARIDNLNAFRGPLSTLKETVSKWRNLNSRGDARAEFASLDKHGVTLTLDKTINEMFLMRCSEYFRLVSENKFDTEVIAAFDYKARTFTANDKQQNIVSLSGGTASILTVLSLASKQTSSLIGNALLVDEFNDVAETLRNETYDRLTRSKEIALAYFAKPKDKSPLTTKTVDKVG